MPDDRVPHGEAASAPTRDRVAGRPRHCWEIVRQIPGLHFSCEECYAYFVQQDCWTLWALRRPGFKPCCQKKDDCTECVVLTERMRPLASETLQIDAARPIRPMPSSTKRVCSYLQLFNGSEEVEGNNKNYSIARALQMRNADLRCRLRGVHLDIGYVNDVCVSRHVEECVFLEETRPEVRVAPAPTLKQGGAVPGKSAPEKGSPKLSDHGTTDAAKRESSGRRP